MKKILTLLSLFCVLLQAGAQAPGGAGRGGNMPSGRFYGKVVDANNKPVEAASVTLLQDRMDTATRTRKEVVVNGMLTPANGDFSLDGVPVMGRYKLRISGIGYQTVTENVQFEMPNRGGDPSSMMAALDRDLGNITLKVDEKVLGNVTVTAARPMLQLGIDRKIFNVDRNLVSAGGSAVDVMKNVPSVNVDLDGNVTVRNTAPQIFVDGRPTNLTLEQIPADAIESVELITNPSAKFDASGGTAGILNIVLKKNKRIGYNGNVRTNIDSRGRVGGGGDLNLRQDKVNFFIAGMVNQRRSIGTGTTDRLNLGARSLRSVSEDRSVMDGVFGFGRTGMDIFLNNRNTFTISGNLARGRMNPENNSDIFIDSLFNGSSEFLNRFSNSTNKFRNWGTQASFRHNFPKAGREWTADATFNKGNNENDNRVTTNYFDMPGKVFDRTYVQSQFGRGMNENLVLQTDYVNPLGQNSKFEVGARASIRRIESLNNVVIANKVNVTEYNNEDRVYAGYASFSNRIKNFGYQLGLRAESSVNEGILNDKTSYRKEFPISLFPSLFLSQKISDFDDLQLNYSRRINRPNFWQLFPFTDYSDSLNISRGNPDLNPEFTNSLELSYSKTLKNRDNIIASVYFKNTNNLITRYQSFERDTILNDSVVVSSFINANSSYITGLELTSRNKLTKFWEATFNANLFTSRIDLENLPDPDQFLSYFFKVNNTFRLPKNLSIQLSADYQSKIISSPGGGGGGRGGPGGGGGFGGGGGSSAQGFIRPNYGVDAGVRLEFLKNRTAALSVNMNDILRTRKFDSYTESPFFIQNSLRRRDPQVVRVNLSWRFGKMDTSIFRRRNTRAENDVNMDGAGMKP